MGGFKLYKNYEIAKTDFKIYEKLHKKNGKNEKIR